MLEIKNIYKSFHGTPMSRFVLGAYAPGVDCLLSVSKSSPQFNCCTPHKGDPSRYQGDGKCMRPRRWALFLNQRWKFRDIESSCGCANPGGGSLATRSATLGSWGWLVPPGDRPEVWSSGRASCEQRPLHFGGGYLGDLVLWGYTGSSALAWWRMRHSMAAGPPLELGESPL